MQQGVKLTKGFTQVTQILLVFLFDITHTQRHQIQQTQQHIKISELHIKYEIHIKIYFDTNFYAIATDIHITLLSE